MKLRATVRKLDIGPGVWVLEPSSGERYVLAGGDAALKKDGLSVEAEGEVVEGAGVAVQGEIFKVKKYKVV